MSAPAPQTGTPVDGAALLAEVEAFHRRFNVFPSEAAYVAVTLWDAHAHLLDCFDSTPRLAFLSPEPGSGKSRALEVVETLVPEPMTAVNASAAALFRSVPPNCATHKGYTRGCPKPCVKTCTRHASTCPQWKDGGLAFTRPKTKKSRKRASATVACTTAAATPPARS